MGDNLPFTKKRTLPRRAIYYDTETTGIDAKKDRIVEIAAFDPYLDKTFNELINPQIPIPKEASQIHGITDEMVKEAPSFEVIGKRFIEFCEGEVVLIAHNNDSFDRHFLKEEALRHSLELPAWPMIDTLKWARKYRSDLPKHSLQFLRQVYGVKENNAHRALDDVVVLHQIFSMMIDDLSLEQVEALLAKEAAFMPFGKHKGKPLRELPKDYVAWLKTNEILEKPENGELKNALEKIFPSGNLSIKGTQKQVMKVE